MARKSWDAYFIDIANAVSSRATCDRKHVGCVLVSDRRIIATGYNGSIPGADHCDEVGHDMVANHCCRTIHAECNAVAQAAKTGINTNKATAYINTFPCYPCFKVLASAGIASIIYTDEYRPDERVFVGAKQAGISITKFQG